MTTPPAATVESAAADGSTPDRSTDRPTDPSAASAPATQRLDSMVREAHATLDRVAAQVAPAVEQLADSAHSASDAAQRHGQEIAEMSHEWAQSLRATVREHPLASLAVALAVGVLVGRLAQGNGR